MSTCTPTTRKTKRSASTGAPAISTQNSGSSLDAQQNVRVLHLLRTLTPYGGGLQTYLEMAYLAMRESPITFSVGCVNAGTPPSNVSGVQHTGRRGSKNLLNALRFARWLRHALKSADVVHIHGIFSWQFLVAVPLCRYYCVPYVVSPHGTLLRIQTQELKLRERWFLALFGKNWLRHAATVIGTTPRDTAVLRSISDLSVSMVMPGIVVPSTPEVEWLKDDRIRNLRIVFLGRIRPVKRIPVLLEALAMLAGRGTPATLDIVGDGEAGALDKLAKQADILGVRNNVTLHGDRRGSDKQHILRRAHVLVMPSQRENFSFAAAESLAIGLPVIVTESVGLAEIIQQTHSGSVVPEGNAAALAEALALYAQPRMRNSTALRAHACAQELLSLSAMRHSLEAIYTKSASIREVR